MVDLLEELTDTIIWWLQKLDKDYQYVNKHCKSLIWRDLISNTT